jgi:hypothetical protein
MCEQVELTRRVDLSNRLDVLGSNARKLAIAQLAPADGEVLKTGPFGSKLHADCFAIEGIPIINISAIGDADVDEQGLLYLKPSLADEFRSYVVQQGQFIRKQ